MGNATSDPCHANYIGKGVFSEKEAQTMRDFYLELKGKIHVLFSFHSAINMLLMPYGYQEQPPADYDKQMQILTASHAKLKATHGMDYKFGTTYSTICEY